MNAFEEIFVGDNIEENWLKQNNLSLDLDKCP